MQNFELTAKPVSCDTEYSAGKICGGCVRCMQRTRPGESGYRCSMKPYDVIIDPSDQACARYWGKEEQAEIDRQREAETERRRKELWAIYAEKSPVKLPIIKDEFGGRIPECPTCGEMPYSTEQCYWCGQRFIQDEDVIEYSKPETVEMVCFRCGKPGVANVSKYNGHKHFHCEYCGCTIME